jgi:hypothetical protein
MDGMRLRCFVGRRARQENGEAGFVGRPLEECQPKKKMAAAGWALGSWDWVHRLASQPWR